MTRSVSFYRDVLGLTLRFESPTWTEFATDGATLVLHTDEGAGWCRPGLQVDDLDEFHLRMVAKHVPCSKPPASVFGARVASYMDPDSLLISVGEERGAR